MKTEMLDQSAVDRIYAKLHFFAYRRELPSGRFVLAQDSVDSVLGVSAADLVSDPGAFDRALDAADREQISAAFRDLGRQSSYTLEYRVRTPHGAVRWIRDSGVIASYPDGTTYLEGVASDITDWPFPRLAIGRAAESVSGLERGIPDLWFVIDASGRFLEFKPSPSIAPLVPPDHFVGKLLEDALPPHVASDARRTIGQALETQTVQTFEYSLERGSGEWYEARIAPLPFDRVLCVVRDITERVKAKEEAQRRNQMLVGLAGCAKILLADYSLTNLQLYLTELGKAAGARGIGLLRYTGEGTPYEIAAQWRKDDGPAFIPDQADCSVIRKPEMQSRLHAGEVVLMLVPPVGVAPIFAEHKPWGVIVFQSGAENATWPSDVKGVFEVAAGHLGTYFEHHQVAAERSRMIDALDASDNAIVVTDDSPAGGILHANRAFRALAPQLQGQVYSLETALQYPVSRLTEDLNASPAGPTVFIEALDRWFQVTRSPINGGDQTNNFVWVFTDVTERKKAERIFFAGLLKEQELNDRKTRLITNISHQFFTPLSVILSSAELIQRLGDRCTPEKRSQLLSRVTQTVEQMTAMMHSHLELEQKPLGEREALSDGVDLGRTLISVIDDLCIEDKRWTGIVPRILGRQRRVRTSERLVRRAIVELLRNAGAYGGEFNGFQIDLDMDQGDVVFSVRDRGPGLPQASGSGVHGLGLAIVRECCQQVGGSFEIGNHPEGGVRAVIRIPDAIRTSEAEARRAR